MLLMCWDDGFYRLEIDLILDLLMSPFQYVCVTYLCNLI